jgi:DNA repair protein RadA/Sms
VSPKTRTIWRCQQCGASAPKWLGRCHDCGEYGTFVEEIEASSATSSHVAPPVEAVTLAEARAVDPARISTRIDELDRVIGGGLVEGSLSLLGGEPGIGKSTLLLQAAGEIAASGDRVMYVCGEESPAQVALRARRVGIDSESLLLLPEVDIAAIERAVRESPPAILVIDSIQTVFDPELAGAAGSVGQVRASTARLVRLAKDLDVTTVVVGHVTKEGSIAGPRVLEHMVDTVLYFEGDSDHAYRVVRAVKNRFGPASEIGVFEMREDGLRGVGDPSALFLGDRGEQTTGSAVMAAMEGSRPVLLEIQALVSPSYIQVPRRLATGIDTSRLLQVLAVLERRAGHSFGGQDVYVSVAGGARVIEPALDLPLALALASALSDSAVPDDVVAFGEIGLTGRVRAVGHSEARLREASRQGFATAISKSVSSAAIDGIALRAVTTVEEALAAAGIGAR